MHAPLDLEGTVISFQEGIFTDAPDNWPNHIANERKYSDALDILFALALRSHRFNVPLEDYNRFLEVTPQEIVDEIKRLDDIYGIDNQTRYEDLEGVPMWGRRGDFLCIECIKEILGRDLTPGDFMACMVTMRSGGIITQLFSNEGEFSAEELAQLSELREQCSHQSADRELQKSRRNCAKDILDNAWNPCDRCGRRVWEDLGVSTDSTTGYVLRNEKWNNVWERWEKIRDDEGE